MDARPELMSICETMAKLVCKTSKLKADDYRLKKELPGVKRCPAFDLYGFEDAYHIIMSCPSLQLLRTDMFSELRALKTFFDQSVLDKGETSMHLLGKQCFEVSIELNYEFHITCASFIYNMYRLVVEGRTGIGYCITG